MKNTRSPSRSSAGPRDRFFLFLLMALIPVSGCDQQDAPLTLDDLSGEEYLFVERMIVLERAKTAALLDRQNGDALLDSLALAWGDSSLQETLPGAPRDPIRSEAVAGLLRRLLKAEQESLLTSTGLERLNLPLSEPKPEPAPSADSQATHPDSLPGSAD